MVKAETTWVLVADGARARVLESLGAGHGLRQVAEHDTHLLRSRELGSDRPGRSYESATTGRHGVEPRVDPHREAKIVFLRGVVDDLDAARQGGRFQRLVVVAPPEALGDLRHLIVEPMRRLVAAELDKDLTKVPLHDMPAHLRDVVRC